MKALVVGGSGLVGTELLKQLSGHSAFNEIVAAVRSPLPESVSTSTEQHVSHHATQHDSHHATQRVTQHSTSDLFAHPMPAGFAPDVVFCCLGTTIKKAGSEEAFRKIDFELPVAIARVALQAGAQHFIVVSATGASATSRVFYNRVKSEMEDAVKGLAYRSVTIVQPSLLLGERSEPRFGEQVAALLMQSFSFLIPKKWQAVHANQVASVMVEAAVNTNVEMRKSENANVEMRKSENTNVEMRKSENTNVEMRKSEN
ncbi:MAG: NAD(P)H-binding protein, partial [Ignavibacteria bacterium]|nr:NAD(P)H-binding protein [Ignavibacteria bacterium]